jgi:hypothetical protein
MSFRITSLFRPAARFEGVRPINIYLLRLLYALMFFMLGNTSWSYIFNHKGPWEADHAMAWAVWTAFATLAGLGIMRPLKLLPIILLEIFYKVLWLILVAYPLWSKGTLTDSPEAYQTMVFLGVLITIVAVPWGYVFAQYIFRRNNA